jgi:hypothetical protein
MTQPLDSAEASSAKEAPRRRRLASAKPAVQAPPSEPLPSGGFIGLWRAINGKPLGAAAQGDVGLTFGFMLCIAGGTALCLVGAFEGVPFARQIGFAGPLLATVAYPIWGASTGAAARPSLRERLADNSYYLGFIFTQIALLVGFLPAAFGAAELSADQIIRFFGVALGASLIGLIARTVLIQMSYSVDEAADVVSGEVSALARQVSKQSAEVLKQFDALVERLASSQAKLTVELQSGMSALTQTVAAYDQALQSDARALHSGVSAASTAAERTATQFDQNQSRLADSLSAIVTVIEELKVALELQVRDATRSIQATTEAVHTGLQSLKGVDGLDRSVAVVDQRVAALSDRLAAIDGQISAVGQSVDQSLGRLDAEIARTTHSGLERAATVNADAKEAAAALERTLQSFRAELDRLRG